MRFLKSFLPHLAIAMQLGLLVLIVLDGRNPLMAFLTSGASKVYMVIMCILSLAVTGAYIADKRK